MAEASSSAGVLGGGGLGAAPLGHLGQERETLRPIATRSTRATTTPRKVVSQETLAPSRLTFPALNADACSESGNFRETSVLAIPKTGLDFIISSA